MNQKLNKTHALLIIALALFFVSCDSTNQKVKDQFGTEISTNHVYSGESSESNTDLSYSFIVPSDYDGTEKLPVIYFLDPQADGQKPLNKYAEIAEQQQVIFIASENIRNGMQQSVVKGHFDALMSETYARFNFDRKQQFIAGFSGGAKLAILYAGDYQELIGAIACGGSMPFGEGYIPNFYFAGLVGSQDFNYLELIQTQNTFTQNGFDFTSVLFDGGHEWAPTESFNLAISGMKLYAMKSKQTEKDDAWIEALYTQMNDSVVAFKASNQMIKEYEYLKQMVRWFYGVKTITDAQKQAYGLEQNRNFVAQVKNKQALTRKEIKLRTEYIRAIELKDLAWWELEAPKLISPSANSADAINISYRLKNYISMVSFMLIKNNLDNNDLEGALKKIKIYELIDAENVDVYLMYARYYFKQNDKVQMLASFTKAQNLGFKDAHLYEDNNSWSALFSQEEIKDLLK